MNTSGDMLNRVYFADGDDSQLTTRLGDFFADPIVKRSKIAVAAAVADSAAATAAGAASAVKEKTRTRE